MDTNFKRHVMDNQNIQSIGEEANSALDFIRRNLRYCPKGCKKTAYSSLVRSTLAYREIVWDPYIATNINKFERIQRQTVRFITGDYKSREEGCVSSNILKNIKLQDLQTRCTSQQHT